MIVSAGCVNFVVNQSRQYIIRIGQACLILQLRLTEQCENTQSLLYLSFRRRSFQLNWIMSSDIFVASLCGNRGGLTVVGMQVL